MSFDTLDTKALIQVAEYFGVELDGAKPPKNAILAALLEDGVTWDAYQEAFVKTEEVNDVEEVITTVTVPPRKVVDPTEGVLLKMERENPYFEIRGYTFTDRHPFQIVTEEDAEFIINIEEGFRVALPSEARNYYDK